LLIGSGVNAFSIFFSFCLCSEYEEVYEDDDDEEEEEKKKEIDEVKEEPILNKV
jgi:hypothetical protein